MNATIERELVGTEALGTAALPQDTYVMKGDYSKKELDTYHLILAPSFECDLRCKHCYLPGHAAGGLTENDVLRLVDEWSDIVVKERDPMGGIFHLKGGEPLILPYLDRVLTRLEKLKTLRFMMTTNGVSGDWDVVERLDRLNAALDANVQIIVSIDGSNDAVNPNFSGRICVSIRL